MASTANERKRRRREGSEADNTVDSSSILSRNKSLSRSRILIPESNCMGVVQKTALLEYWHMKRPVASTRVLP